MYLKEVFMQPSMVIKNAKKDKDLGKSILLMLLGGVLLSIGVMLAPKGAMGNAVPQAALWGVSLIVIAFTFIWSLLLGLMVQLAFSLLTGKGEYYHAFTPLAYSIYIGSIGILAFALLSYIPFIGAPLGGLALLFSVILATFFAYRLYMEYYGLDLTTVFLALFMIKFSTVFVMYMVIAQYILSFTSQYGGHMGAPWMY